MSNLSVTKSVLAKLLASENITVVHDSKIKTAMFDTTARVLYLPVWEVMDGPLYDLLVGHEDGHALHTPDREWNAAIDAHPKDVTYKDCMNIIEDARIEKMIKRSYPGLNRSFAIGYRDLFDRDFFGVNTLKDYSSLNILDRINLYFKCGGFIVLPFSDEERVIVRDITDAETFEQVLEITDRVYKHAQEEEENKIANMEDLTEQLLKQFEDGLREQMDTQKSDKKGEKSNESGKEKGKSGKASDKASDKKPESSDEKGKGTGKEKSKEKGKGEGKEKGKGKEESETSSSEGGKDSGDKEPKKSVESVTDRTFRQRQEELVQDGVEVHTFTFPKPILSSIIVPPKVITDRFFDNAKSANLQNTPMVKTCVDRFTENNKRYIAMLIKEFEMRKNAKQYARTTTARTGELDMGKLHQYKFNNDLFRKISVVQKGKSHGIVLFLDMSSSMRPVFGPTMEQTLILATFCKKIGIPFDVYGFSDDSAFLYHSTAKGALKAAFTQSKFQKVHSDSYTISSESGFHLKHLLGSSFSPMQYRASFEMLAVVSMNFMNKRFPYIKLDWSSNGFRLSGTPFIQTLMASRPMIEDFKAKHQVDICNVIYLTDGEGCSAFDFNFKVEEGYDPVTNTMKRVSQRIYFVDQRTKQKVEIPQFGTARQQSKITEFVRQLTGCKHIGFYLADGGTINGKLENRQESMTPTEGKTLKDFYRANDYFSYPHIGYDIYYYMRSRSENIEDGELTLTPDMNTQKITTAFSNMQENKKRNRALVSSLAQEFAA